MDKSKNYIPNEFNNNIFNIFPNFWLYKIPLDLSCSYTSKDVNYENENNSPGPKIDTYLYKYLPKNLINILFEDDTEFLKKESSSNNNNNYDNLKSNFGCKNPKKQIFCREINKEKTAKAYSFNSLKSPCSYNINISKPNINFVNMYYSPSYNYSINDNFVSRFNFDSYLNSNSILNFNYINCNLVNSSVSSNIGIENISNCININITNEEKEKNKSLNNYINNNNPTKENNKKSKKPKKKKNNKKKLEDKYTIEISGRIGWICENCHNFNYESRKTCNRCKTKKLPIEKSILFKKDGSNILSTILNENIKKDWNCEKCGNTNYSFRMICNRCQNPRKLKMKIKTK